MLARADPTQEPFQRKFMTIYCWELGREYEAMTASTYSSPYIGEAVLAFLPTP
jgi:hypothetical protein